MKGKYQVIVQDKRIRYDFEIRRNITIIRGDSATGKTTLLELLTAYEQEKDESGIEIICEKRCTVLTTVDWQARLAGIRDSLVFIDEVSRFTASEEFAAAIQGTDNYYIIVSREPLENLPYSVDEVYGIRTSEKYAGLKKTYNEFFHLYGDQHPDVYRNPGVVIAEDSHSGYDFFEAIYDEKGIRCISAKGKSNIHRRIRECKQIHTLVIADGAAFGSEMERIMRLIEAGNAIALYLPESFEWLLLQAGLLKDPEINEILADPESFVESTEYFSWERFFTDLLVRKTENTYLKYTKRKLNPVYLQMHEKKAILQTMRELFED